MSFDLTKLLVTEDWFSDISPQTMRRLLNIVSVTGDFYFPCSVIDNSFYFVCIFFEVVGIELRACASSVNGLLLSYPPATTTSFKVNRAL